MSLHKFVEYSRIFKKHGIPLGLRPNTIIYAKQLGRMLTEPLYAARAIDTALQHKMRKPGFDGVTPTDIRMIIRGPGSGGAGKLPPHVRRLASTRTLPALMVRPFQGRPLRDLYDLVEGMQHAMKTGKYDADPLLPRGWDQRWYRAHCKRMQEEKDAPSNNHSDRHHLSIADGEEHEEEVEEEGDMAASSKNGESSANGATGPSMPGYGALLPGRAKHPYEERPFLGSSTMYDRCMDQYCFDLIMAALPLDYLYEAGNHALPLRSVRTAHRAIAQHVEGMRADLQAAQSYTSTAGEAAKPAQTVPVLLEIAMLRLKDHIPRNKVMNLFAESVTSFYSNTTASHLISVISSLVHRPVQGDIATRQLGLAPNNALTELLANVYLYPLDAFLISRGYRVVRHLDRVVVVLPDIESAIRVSRDIVFFAEGELGVPASLHRTQLLPVGERDIVLHYEAEIDPATGRYNYYIPQSQAQQLDKTARKLHAILANTPDHTISKEAYDCARQILGRASLYLAIESDIPSVSRISKLYERGSLTIEGIIKEVRSWKEVPEKL